MQKAPIPPYHTPVNPTGQWIMAVGSFVLATLVVLAVVRIMRNDRSPVPALLVLGVAVGSLLEPLYDNTVHILWYIPGQWNLYTAFDVPQPIWIWAGYVGTYGAAALYVYRKARAGASPRLFLPAGIIFFVSYSLSEMMGVNLGTYVYYGVHPFRLLDFPLWVAPIDTAVPFTAGVVAALARQHASGAAGLVAGALAFPFAFTMLVFGAGFPTLNVVSEQAAPSMWTYLAALLTVALTGCAVWLTCLLLPLCPPSTRTPATQSPSHNRPADITSDNKTG